MNKLEKLAITQLLYSISKMEDYAKQDNKIDAISNIKSEIKVALDIIQAIKENNQ